MCKFFRKRVDLNHNLLKIKERRPVLAFIFKGQAVLVPPPAQIQFSLYRNFTLKYRCRNVADSILNEAGETKLKFRQAQKQMQLSVWWQWIKMGGGRNEEVSIKAKPRIAGSYRGFNFPLTQKKGKLYGVKLQQLKLFCNSKFIYLRFFYIFLQKPSNNKPFKSIQKVIFCRFLVKNAKFGLNKSRRNTQKKRRNTHTQSGYFYLAS